MAELRKVLKTARPWFHDEVCARPCEVLQGNSGAPYRIPEQNPVRAGLTTRPYEYPRSSAMARVAREDDSLAKAAPLLELVGNWKDFLSRGGPRTGSGSFAAMNGRRDLRAASDSLWPLRGS